MFHRVLIPLDGTSHAEVALTYLNQVRTGGILLAGVGPTDCTEYLKGVRARLPSVIDVQLACVPGEPAEAILRMARSAGCDLILMTSHGHISDQVTRQACCPVLFVGDQAVAPRPDPAAQAALERAQELVEGCL